jgi:hypothetical protein
MRLINRINQSVQEIIGHHALRIKLFSMLFERCDARKELGVVGCVLNRLKCWGKVLAPVETSLEKGSVKEN